MKLLIIEDEMLAAKRLNLMLEKTLGEFSLLGIIESVEEAVEFFSGENEIDLLFLDIHLADGLCFEIFDYVSINCPIIFTTAYDQYAIQAFKFNSIDYLLKPIDEEEFKKAIEKYKGIKNFKTVDLETIQQSIPQRTFSNRLLVKKHVQLKSVPVSDIAFIYSKDGITFVRLKDGSKYHIEKTLGALEKRLNDTAFFRINRAMIIEIDGIESILTYTNNRLKIQLKPSLKDLDAIVSREKVKAFKQWLGD